MQMFMSTFIVYRAYYSKANYTKCYINVYYRECVSRVIIHNTIPRVIIQHAIQRVIIENVISMFIMQDAISRLLTCNVKYSCRMFPVTYPNYTVFLFVRIKANSQADRVIKCHRGRGCSIHPAISHIVCCRGATCKVVTMTAIQNTDDVC